MAYELKYFGASPGRWSGGGGLNVQNFNRRETEGLDVRRCVMAAPGHVLAVADYSQIEARVLLFLAGDTAALELLADHPEWDMYELHARATMGWKPEVGGRRTEVGGRRAEDGGRRAEIGGRNWATGSPTSDRRLPISRISSFPHPRAVQVVGATVAVLTIREGEGDGVFDAHELRTAVGQVDGVRER